MTPPLPKTTSRLARAALAEREGLQRHRTKLAARREALLAQVEDLDAGLRALDERIALLDGLAGERGHNGMHGGPPVTTSAEEDQPGSTLRGPAIRERAVHLLSHHAEGHGPIHYRRWFELLTQAGYQVAGKDPLAVFLTQLSRSPLVRRTTRAGYYELNRAAPEELGERLGRLQGELGALATKPTDGATLADVRKRRDELLASIGKTERALEEALDVLEEDSAAPPRFAAAG
jgi:hypothetical protein